MSFEYFDDPLEVHVLPFLELVAAGADTPGCRRGPQESDLLLGSCRKVEQLFLEDPFDAELSGVNRAKCPGMSPAGFDDPAERVIDDAGRPSRLGDDDVASGHGSIDPFPVEVGVMSRISAWLSAALDRLVAALWANWPTSLVKRARPFLRLQHAPDDEGKARATPGRIH